MSSSTGVQVMGNYAGAANDQARVQVLIDMLPDPDTASSSGASAAAGAGAGFFDEMSPVAAMQLRVELTALKAAVSAT